MLPTNARQGDFVEVSNKEHKYYGMVGRLKGFKDSSATVDIYGKLVEVDKECLTLRARMGTGTHDELKEQLEAQECNNLTAEDYDHLINGAIDMQDWPWATELVNRKQALLSKNKV